MSNTEVYISELCAKVNRVSYNCSEHRMRLLVCAIARNREAYRNGDKVWREVVQIAESMARGMKRPDHRPKLTIGNDQTLREYAPLEKVAIDAFRLLYFSDISNNVSELVPEIEVKLVEDVLGNLFTKPYDINKDQRHIADQKWRTREVKTLAMGVYHSKEFMCSKCLSLLKLASVRRPELAYPNNEDLVEQMAKCDCVLKPMDNLGLKQLADMIEENGCNNDNPVLTHLRSDEVHVRGCWAVDSIIGYW